jgi:hypothetical protein
MISPLDDRVELRMFVVTYTVVVLGSRRGGRSIGASSSGGVFR